MNVATPSHRLIQVGIGESIAVIAEFTGYHYTEKKNKLQTHGEKIYLMTCAPSEDSDQSDQSLCWALEGAMDGLQSKEAILLVFVAGCKYHLRLWFNCEAGCGEFITF